VGVQVPKLGPEKSRWVVMTPSGLQVLHHLWVSECPSYILKEPMGAHDPKWSSSPNISVGVRVPKLDPEKSQWVVTTSSDLQVFTSLMSLEMPKLDPEKRQWVITTPSGLQVLTSLVGVRLPKLERENSNWVVTTPSGVQVFKSSRHLWVSKCLI